MWWTMKLVVALEEEILTAWLQVQLHFLMIAASQVMVLQQG